MILGPKGWSPQSIHKRYAASAPQSYNSAARTVNCCISAGSPVKRFFGTETLRIDSRSVDLERVQRGLALVLDSHRGDSIHNVLGKISNAWIEGGRLMGTIAFNDTPQGRAAEGMVARNELSGVSAGYSVQAWEITNKDGRVLDPDTVSWDDDDLVFCATKWLLMECSLVCSPADAASGIRSSNGNSLADIRARMRARQAISDRNSRILNE
jgi:hypothetical protein